VPSTLTATLGSQLTEPHQTVASHGTEPAPGRGRRTLRNCVPFQAGRFGLTMGCVAQCENVLFDEVTGPIGILDDVSMRDVINAIGYVVESDCEPT